MALNWLEKLIGPSRSNSNVYMNESWVVGPIVATVVKHELTDRRLYPDISGELYKEEPFAYSFTVLVLGGIDKRGKTTLGKYVVTLTDGVGFSGIVVTINHREKIKRQSQLYEREFSYANHVSRGLSKVIARSIVAAIVDWKRAPTRRLAES